jgi:hypothetical protein
MYNKPAKCATPTCPNMSYHLYCLSCSAQEVSARSLQATQGLCVHGHSIIGEYETIKRLLPEYMGGHAQPGFMLDVCKTCFQALQERPYNPIRLGRKH